MWNPPSVCLLGSKRGCLGERCLFVVQALIKIRISSSLFTNMLCVHYLFLCHSDGSVYVYCKQPLSCEAEHWWGECGGNCCIPGKGRCCFEEASCCCFEGLLIPLSHLCCCFCLPCFVSNRSRAEFILLFWPLTVPKTELQLLPPPRRLFFVWLVAK